MRDEAEEARGEEGEEVSAPPKAQELLAAVQEFDKKTDPLDLSTKPSGDAPHHAAALLAGRKLSRLARRFAGAHDKEVAALRSKELKLQERINEALDLLAVMTSPHDTHDGRHLIAILEGRHEAADANS